MALLDNLSGGLAGFGMRQLKDSATKSIRVTHGSTLGETDIGFVNGQLDTSTLLTFANGGNVFVNTFYDQSGNNRNLGQTTLDNMPKIVTNGVVEVDSEGKPAPLFDGSNDYMSRGATIGGYTTSVSLVAKFEAHRINTLQAIAGQGYLATTNGFGVFTRSVNSQYGFNVRTGNTESQPNDTLSLNQIVKFVGVRVPNDSILYKNGTEISRNTTVLSSIVANNWFEIGARLSGTRDFYFQGHIGEVIMFDRNLNDTEVASVYIEASINMKLDSTTIDKVYLGSNIISKMYLGTNTII
jgi:hypothetical protein